VTEPKTAIDDRKNMRLTPELHRRLLTIQYERKMAGEPLSFNDIITRLLDELERLRSQVTP
jgi:hypothetical protein